MPIGRAGTGHAIVPPETLRRTLPDVVIRMNPIYEAEVRRQLRAMDLMPHIIPCAPDAQHWLDF